MKAALVLEDGAVFEGSGFGGSGRAFGETVFYTGIVGYQEVVTNPSYRGTLVVMTYPIIGSYGVNDQDNESPGARAAGVIVRDYSAHYSNFRATGSFEDFLSRQGIVGLRGVDTRAIAVHLRENGEMKGAIVPGDFDVAEVTAKLKNSPSPFDDDLADDVSFVRFAGPRGRKLLLVDAGAVTSLISQLSDLKFAREDAAAGEADISSPKTVGLIVAGGPGDPRKAARAAKLVASAIGKVPVMGIGLGHGLVALALGCKVSRMKAGHHGVNHSVRDIEAGKCIITAQHHSFAVDPSVPDGVDVTHANVNDGTVEGISSRKLNARGVQFHPGRDDMGAPGAILEKFVKGRNA